MNEINVSVNIQLEKKLNLGLASHCMTFSWCLYAASCYTVYYRAMLSVAFEPTEVAVQRVDLF